MRRFICCVCGSSFRSEKPQNPQRDTGFGTCERCRQSIAADAITRPRYHNPEEDYRAYLNPNVA